MVGSLKNLTSQKMYLAAEDMQGSYGDIGRIKTGRLIASMTVADEEWRLQRGDPGDFGEDPENWLSRSEAKIFSKANNMGWEPGDREFYVGTIVPYSENIEEKYDTLYKSFVYGITKHFNVKF